jgi:hypothetical protein
MEKESNKKYLDTFNEYYFISGKAYQETMENGYIKRVVYMPSIKKYNIKVKSPNGIIYFNEDFEDFSEVKIKFNEL